MSVIDPVLGRRPFLHTQLYGGIIKGYFEEIPWDKRLKITAIVLFMVILNMIMLNCIFVMVVGLYGQ